MRKVISTFYSFFQIKKSTLPILKIKLLRLAQKHDIMGLFLIGTEGCNSTFSGTLDKVESFKKELVHLLNQKDIKFKDSQAGAHPFHELKVKIKPEIVSLGRPDLTPVNKNRHLKPTEWHQALQDENTVVFDIRNKYEFKLGHFKKAIHPDIDEFNEFPDYIKQSNIENDKKVLIYCTGGIRCEKAILSMEEQGYKNVYQLDGGILNYLKEYPHQEFKGECFVFDYRVAVNQNLQPSEKYRICPHCGDPGSTKMTCIQCGKEDVVCDKCLSKEAALETCSKNCAHHYRLGHTTKRIHQDSYNKRRPQGL